LNNNTNYLLNEKLNVVKYNGGMQDNNNQYDVKNTLCIDQTKIHCSAEGNEYILFLKSELYFNLTDFIIKAANNCSSQLKNGLIYVTDNEIIEDIENITPTLKFITNDLNYCLEHKFEENIKGKNIIIKFIDAHGENDNINIGTFMFIGSFNNDNINKEI